MKNFCIAVIAILIVFQGCDQEKDEVKKAYEYLKSIDSIHSFESPNEDRNSVKGLNFQDSKISDEGIRYLLLFPNLENLDLSNTSISDTGLVELLKFSKLSSLNLSSTKITCSGIRVLSKSKSISILELAYNNQLDDKCLIFLSSFPKLKSIEIGTTSISPEAAGKLRSLGIQVSRFEESGNY
ncbi:hypothetical protein [Leptospira sp. P2653]|uniref:hypothetical protein n=1 Tax=Leptospira sp. P2653 TaxID=1218600 RepID=UPI0006890101|nr:hypothetical protein [Leptospira sp. P2653]